MPLADLYPDSFAKEAAKMAKTAGLKLKVFKEAELKKMKMNLLLGVGQGSVRPPRLIHFTYEPASAKDKKKKPIVLVGKGITFDSGGLSLKPSAMMMKIDMGVPRLSSARCTSWCPAKSSGSRFLLRREYAIWKRDQAW